MASGVRRSQFDDDYEGDDDVFGDVAPLVLPPHLAHLATRGESGSGSGPRAATGDFGTAGTADDATVSRDAAAEDDMEWEEEQRQDTLVPELIRHWTNERLAPDILDQRGELIQNILQRIREQAALVQRLRADPEANEDEHFKIILVQTEVERVRFIVRSYIRTRLDKIEKYAHYILANVDMQRRLSTIELNHAQTYAALVDSQFNASVLNALPESLSQENDQKSFPSMISKPDKDIPLFVHALQDCGRVLLPDGDSFEIKKGSIHLVRYVTIEEHLRRGEVELV